MVVRYLYCLSGVQKVLSRLFSLFISGFVSHRFQCVSQVFRHLVSRGPSEKNYGPHRYVGLGSFGRSHNLGGCETPYLSLLKRRKSISSVFFVVRSLLLSLRWLPSSGRSCSSYLWNDSWVPFTVFRFSFSQMSLSLAPIALILTFISYLEDASNIIPIDSMILIYFFGNEVDRLYICLQTRLLGQSWTKIWRLRLSECYIVEFLNKTERKKFKTYSLMDVIYFLKSILQEKKNICLYPETVPRSRPKFWGKSTRR